MVGESHTLDLEHTMIEEYSYVRGVLRVVEEQSGSEYL